MKKFVLFVTVAFILVFYSNNAFAYLDPGTGSMILQSILATCLFVGTAVGIFWRRIKTFFGRFRKDASKENRK